MSDSTACFRVRMGGLVHYGAFRVYVCNLSDLTGVNVWGKSGGNLVFLGRTLHTEGAMGEGRDHLN